MNEMFPGHFEDIIVDEIALEGLEGITLEGLWARLSQVLKIRLPLRPHICTQVWNFILKLPRHLTFFILPKPRSKLKIVERVNKLEVPEVIDDSPQFYGYNQISDGQIRGSCEFYKERAEIGYAELADKTLEEINEKWGDTFVIVAVQHLRDQALILDTHMPTLPSEMKLQQYCFLERIGRSRYYGETTIGKNSLLNICNESVLVFYIRCRLSHLKLITKQHYYEKSQSGSLLLLSRFATMHRPKQIVILADAIRYLQEKPSGIAEHGQLKSYLAKHHDLCLKKIFQTNLFKKYIVSDTFMYRDIYPNAKPEQYMKKSSKKDEKSLKGLKLRDVNVNIDDICEEEDVEDEETVKSFLTKDNVYLDMTICEQMYEKVKAHGEIGCSQTELASFLGCRKLCMRRYIKKMTRTGVLSHYLKDSGRQRLKMYILTKYSLSDSKPLPSEPIAGSSIRIKSEINGEDDLLEPLKEAEPVSCLQFADKNEPEFKMYVKEYYDKAMLPPKRLASDLTEKQKQRRLTVIHITKENRIIDSLQLIKDIMKSEENLGYTNKICRKSLTRILTPMIEQKILKIFDVTMQWREYAKHLKLVCIAPINLEHKLLTDELLRLKESFFNMIAMKKQKVSILSIQFLNKQNNIRREDLGKNHSGAGCVGAAKYIRAKLLHEILYYLVYGLESDQKPIDFNEAVKSWRESDPALNASEIQSELGHELPKIYTREVNWMMFLAPIPKYDKYPIGWICIKDLLRSIPLTLLLKLHRVNDNTSSQLQNYLKHPIRRYYTLHSLPLEIHDSIRFDRSYVRSIDDILKLLGYTGLIQFGPRVFRDQIRNHIYVNRNALFLDTSPSEPGYSQISDDRNYKEVRFHFQTQTDVVNFWSSLQSTCMATKLGYRGKKSTEKRQRPILAQLPETSIASAVKKDVGYLIGNKRGAAGLDWKLFSHKTRNWDLSYTCHPKHPETHSKARSRLRYTTVTVPQRGVRSMVLKRYRKPVVVKQYIKKVSYDDVDKECLKLMDQLRVRWNHREDRLLMICRVVMNFLQGNSGQRATTCFTWRDILHWHLGSYEKSSRACQRRILYLMRNKTNVNQVNSWLNELYQNEYINRAYGPNFLVELRKLYPIGEVCSIASRIYFVQVVWFLIQLLDKTTVRQIDCIPETLQQFNLLYRKTYDNHTQLKHFDPETVDEVNESTINALIHSSVCCQRDKMLYNIQLFEIYKTYDEGLIDRCYKKVRADQMIVIGKIFSRPNNLTLMGKKVCISNIYRQQFFLLLPYSVYGQYYESLESLLNTFFNPDVDNKSTTYTCVNSGTTILISELSSIPGLIFEIQAPKQVLKFDPVQVQNSIRTPDKVLDHFRNLLQLNSQQVEYGKDVANEQTKPEQTKTRFSINHSIHKINYNPYDIISKLPDAEIHFFCALQHINTEIDLADLKDRPYNCPFYCILHEENYLNTIANVLNEKATVVKEIIENSKDPPAIDDDENMEKKFLLQPENILDVVNRIRTFIRQERVNIEKKDLGNIRLSQHLQNVVKLAQDASKISSLGDDGGSSDEEELLMQRDDTSQKMSRFQDYLQVNTPKLILRFESGEGQNMRSYKNMQVAEVLLPTLNKKETVLNKATEESLWKYSEMSIDELDDAMKVEDFTEHERNLTKEILCYIENSELGVKSCDLVENFSPQSLIIKSLKILRKNFLIKRVGVESFMYVHNRKVRPWIIHSFHLKRLERESLVPQGEMRYENKKRKLMNNDTNEETPETKKSKMEPSTSREKRAPKPVKRYGDEETTEKTTPTEKINVYMRPAPWMRINGTLNRRVFDKWMGTLLLECTIRSGIPVKSLFTRFNQLHPVNILFLLECLQDLECVQLKIHKDKPNLLFSNDCDIEVCDADELSKPENMFVIVKPDAILKMSLFIGDKKYQVDF